LNELEAAFNETLFALTDPRFITVVFQPWSPVIDGDVVLDQPLRLFIEVRHENAIFDKVIHFVYSDQE